LAAMRMIPASDSSLLIVFGDSISNESHERVITLFRALDARCDARIRNLHPAYASLLIDFDPLRASHEELQLLVEDLTRSATAFGDSSFQTITIPVCYEAEYAPDLAEVAAHSKLPTEEVIRLHSSETYAVYFLGFSPGFAYMGVLPPVLRIPRLGTPRTHVAAGSVAIAEEQTAVYPVDSPGGWRLIGRTPIRIFDPEVPQPSRFQTGDRVRFVPIDRETFSDMSRER
jgi:KipI family sensor histidine kinase inhibitor